MAPQFVKPYVKTNKNDRNDAEAICEAVSRPHMRFVAVKTAEMQAVLALHRARQGFVKARTAQANQIRGLLAEFGIVIPKGIGHIAKRVPVLEDGENGLPGMMRQLLERLGGVGVAPVWWTGYRLVLKRVQWFSPVLTGRLFQRRGGARIQLAGCARTRNGVASGCTNPRCT